MTLTLVEGFAGAMSSDVGRRLAERARAGRRHALSAISHVVVTVTDDGKRTWEESFSRPPTLTQLMSRVGDGAFVVSIAMRRRPRRAPGMLRLAAE